MAEFQTPPTTSAEPERLLSDFPVPSLEQWREEVVRLLKGAPYEKKMLTPHLVPKLQEALGRLDLPEVQTLCRGTPSLLTNILSAGIERIGADGVVDVAVMEKAMEEASVEESAAGMKTISYLSIIAQLSPMLGLLGTVTGMIKAFDAISKGGMGKPDALAGNIGEAMVTTAAGLIIGIPAMFAYFHLKSRYNANVARLSRVLGNLLHRLSEALRRPASAAGAAPAAPANPLEA